MSETAQCLSLAANPGREYFADEHPDHGPLAERMANHHAAEQPDQPVSVDIAVKDPGHQCQTYAATNAAANQQRLAANFVNDRHAHQGRNQIDDTKDDRLHGARSEEHTSELQSLRH